MSINLQINADVVDIRSDNPQPNDEFFVDTNAWYWFAYTRFKQGRNRPQYYQTTDYPNYILKGLKIGSNFLKTGLAYAELAHIIERYEHEIFEKSQKLSPKSIRPKEFRHNYPVERPNVVRQIQQVWQQIDQFAVKDILIDGNFIAQSDGYMTSCNLDGYDLFQTTIMFNTGITKIITDDGDFATVAGITLFTANPTVITAAQNVGKLIRR